MSEFKSYHIYPVSIAIRTYLTEVEEASPSAFYKDYKPFKPTTSYGSIVRYFWMLKKMGLIVKVRREKGPAPIPKTIYKVVRDLLDDPRWKSPQKAMWPKHFKR